MDDTKFRVNGQTLEEYFNPKNDGQKVTRKEMRQLMALLASKAAVHEAMKVLGFELRTSLRRMIEEERQGMGTNGPAPEGSRIETPEPGIVLLK